MVIYYLMVEAFPNHNNPESKKYGGAYINCWVKASTKKEALSKVKKYIREENWTFLKIEDIWIAEKHLYTDLSDSLECYNEARKYGISFIFNTWSIDAVE